MLLIVKILIIFNCFIFYGSLILMDAFDFKVHLPLHLCYLTEIFILLSLIFKTKFLYPWLVLNSLGGGITEFTNSNLPIESLIIENIHLHLSHFNLLLFVLILYKMKFSISKKIL